MYRLIDVSVQTSLRHVRITPEDYERLPFRERQLYRPESDNKGVSDLGHSLLDDVSWPDNMDADF